MDIEESLILLEIQRRRRKNSGVAGTKTGKATAGGYDVLSGPITALPVCVGSASPRRVVTFFGRCTSGYGVGVRVDAEGYA